MESTMNQIELWKRVIQIKVRVRDTIGTDLSHEFRSLPEYAGYCGLCGEAQFAYEDEQLDERIVALLDEYADKVIAIWTGISEKSTI